MLPACYALVFCPEQLLTIIVFVSLLRDFWWRRLAFLRLRFNSELTVLYWQIGRDIIERQDLQGWGSKVVGQLTADLLREFPGPKGWSRSNLMAMRAFAEAWPDKAIVRQLVGQLPREHNLKLLSGLKSAAEREWYARAALEHGWSRSVLVHQMETLLHQRQGVAVTNFKDVAGNSLRL